MSLASANLSSITYVSTAAKQLTPEVMQALLSQSRTNNERNGITGVLAVRGENIFQVCEGPIDAVRELLQSLREDPRHTGMQLLLEESITDRRFSAWTMHYEQLDGYPRKAIPGYDLVHSSELPRSQKRRSLSALMSWLRRDAGASDHPTTQ